MNKLKILFCVLSIGFYGCAGSYSKTNLIHGRSATYKSPYGSYIEVIAKDSTYKGEFITFKADTLFIMQYENRHSCELVKLHVDDFDTLDIILTRNHGKEYLLATGIAIIPAFLGATSYPDYSGPFLSFGAITLVTSGLAALIEVMRTPTVVSYPEKVADVSLLTKYARFPVGFPEKFDASLLEHSCAIDN